MFLVKNSGWVAFYDTAAASVSDDNALKVRALKVVIMVACITSDQMYAYFRNLF
jgi:hypothetical protein